jgi:hypothetical protein
MYLTKKSSEHFRKYKRKGTEDGRHSNRGRETNEHTVGQEQYGKIEIGAQKGGTGAVYTVYRDYGRRKEDGRNETDHLRQRMEDKEQTYILLKIKLSSL